MKYREMLLFFFLSLSVMITQSLVAQEEAVKDEKSVAEKPEAAANKLFQELIEKGHAALTIENLREIASYLDNESVLSPQAEKGDEWYQYIKVCDGAALALESFLKGVSVKFTTSTMLDTPYDDFRYQLLQKEERLTFWRQWWAQNKEKNIEQIGVLWIEEGLKSPLLPEDQKIGMKRSVHLGRILNRWIHWDFYITPRLFVNQEDISVVSKEIGDWWALEKEKSLDAWHTSAESLKSNEKYAQINKDIMKKQREKQEVFQKMKDEVHAYMKKNHEEDVQTFSKLTKTLMTKENVQRALERMKVIKPELKYPPVLGRFTEREDLLKNAPVFLTK